MPKKENLPAVNPQESQEVAIEYDSYIGFKDNVQYSQDEFAMLWEAMLQELEPNIEIETDDNQKFLINTFGLMKKGYACTISGDIEFDLSNETSDVIYLWAKLNLNTEKVIFTFDTTGVDLSVNDTDIEFNVYLGKLTKITDKKYFWNNEVQLGAGSRLDNLLKPDIIENPAGWKIGDIVTAPKSLDNYVRLIIHTLRTDNSHSNIMAEGIIPEKWDSSASIRANSSWTDGKTVHSYHVLLNLQSADGDPTHMHIAQATAFRHATASRTPHTKLWDFKITKIELYTY